MRGYYYFFFYHGRKTRTWNCRRSSPKSLETVFRPIVTRDGQRAHGIKTLRTSLAPVACRQMAWTVVKLSTPNRTYPRPGQRVFVSEKALRYVTSQIPPSKTYWYLSANVTCRARVQNANLFEIVWSCLDGRLFGCFSTTVLPLPTPFRSPPLVHYCFTIFYSDRNDNTQYAERKWKKKKLKKIATVNCIRAHNTFKADGQRRQSADHALTIANAHNGSYGTFAVSPLHTPQLQ